MCLVPDVNLNECLFEPGRYFGNLQYSKIQNGRHFSGGENFLKIAKITFLRYPVDENFDEITLSRTVKEIEANLCFAIFGENSKWPPFLGRGIFFENCKDYIP